jgi:allantoinase
VTKAIQLTIRGTRVVLPDGERPASILIDGGKISRIDARDGGGPSDTIDVGDLVVSPGIVDTHVHVNEPGRTEWEGFDTATRAAAAGGVTTIVDMPLNSIPATTTVTALAEKRAAADRQCHVDVGFWGGVVPGNHGELDGLADAGVRGFKCFLVPSGVDEFPAVDEGDLRRALPILARRRMPLLVHAESPEIIAEYAARAAAAPPSNPKYRHYLGTRPPEAEVNAVQMVVELAREFGARVHIVHVASAEAAEEIARAKDDGVGISAETCPHYLTFAAEQIADGATEFKCAPPIRESRQREALWEMLERGVLDFVATDHSPAPPSMKCPGDFIRAWGGIASLEMSLAAVWSGVTRRAAAPNRSASTTLALAQWLSERPAALAGLDAQKGRIAPGHDADLVIWDPAAEFTVDPSQLQQRHKITPYAGQRLRGRVKTTFVRGTQVWDDGRLVRAGSGQLL